MSVFTDQLAALKNAASKLEVDFEDVYNEAVDELRSRHSNLSIEVWEDGVSVANDAHDANSLESELIFLIEEGLGLK